MDYNDCRSAGGHIRSRNGATVFFFSLFNGLDEHLRQWRDYRRLDDLPDYLLDDLGLTRADIAAAARRLL